MSVRSTRRRFTVLSDPGRYNFPIDMLRYDACWPERSVDVAAVEDPGGSRDDGGRTAVVLLTDSPTPPTAARWASYGWHVTTVEAVG